MNIVVCMKQVPDAAKIRIDKTRMTIIREGVESIINPLDGVALEAALGLRDREGGTITVLSMGPPQSAEALLEALAYGADRAVLLTDPRFAGADTLATSRTLARAVSRLTPPPDLILCGQQTTDSDTGHVGPQLAEALDLPQVCGVNEIHPEGDHLVVKRVSDGFLDTFRVRLPALLTVCRELDTPHHIPLGNLERSFSDPVLVQWELDDLGMHPSEAGMEGSATRVVGLKTPPPKRKGEMVEGSPQVLADRLIQQLEAVGVLDEDTGSE